MTKYQRQIASDLATEIIEEGLVVGEDLEWYLRLSTKGFIVFDSEEKYIAFEDLVLKFVDMKTKYVKVLDIITNQEFKFNNLKDASYGIGVTKERISSAISGKCLMMKRYRVEYARPAIKELY